MTWDTGWTTWSVAAGHLQAVNRWGSGLGRVDDTFSSVGARYASGDTSGELRGGWGPALGFQVLGGGQLRRGDDTYYGGYSVDVDGPDFGTQRAVSGVSTRVGIAARSSPKTWPPMTPWRSRSRAPSGSVPPLPRA